MSPEGTAASADLQRPWSTSRRHVAILTQTSRGESGTGFSEEQTRCQRPGVSTGRASESTGPATPLLPEPQFSSSTKWGQTGKIGSRASHPGAHVLFLAPDAGPAPGLQLENPPDPPRHTSPSPFPRERPAPACSFLSACQGAVSSTRSWKPAPQGQEGRLGRQTAHHQPLPGPRV